MEPAHERAGSPQARVDFGHPAVGALAYRPGGERIVDAPADAPATDASARARTAVIPPSDDSDVSHESLAVRFARNLGKA